MGLRQPVTVAIKEPGQASGATATPSGLHCYYLVRGYSLESAHWSLATSGVSGGRVHKHSVCDTKTVITSLLYVCRNVQLNTD